MIGVESDLAPSCLLHYEMARDVVKTLLEKSCAFRLECEWEQAMRCAEDAVEFCSESADQLGLALAHLHLVDLYCEIGEIGRAFQLCIGIRETFQRHSDPVHRHNEAVATYTIGLLHQLQLLGSPMKALHMYEEALAQFSKAQEHWDKRIKEQAEEAQRPWKELAIVKTPEEEAVDEQESRFQYLERLRLLLTASFDEEELKTVCIDLGADYESLPAIGKENKARELVLYFNRRGKIRSLASRCKRERPTLHWEEGKETKDEQKKARAQPGQAPSDAQNSMTLEQLELYSQACQRAREWIENRRKQIISRRISQDEWQSVVDIWPPESRDKPFPDGHGRIGHIIDEDHVRIHRTKYRSDRPIKPDQDYYCFALPIRGDDLAFPKSRPNGYILVRQRWQMDEEQVGVNELGVLWQRQHGWSAVDFKRGIDGRVELYPRSATIIGDDRRPTGKVMGYCVAILKPDR